MLPVDAAGPAVLHVVLGAQQLEWGLRRGRQWLPESEGSLPIAEASVPALLAACEKLAQIGESTPAKRVHMHVLVADVWLMLDRVPWSDALQRTEQADSYAREQLASAGFDVQPDDVVRFDDGPFGQPRMVAAYSAALLAALVRTARCWGGSLNAVLPLSVAAWDWARKQRTAEAGAALLVWAPGCLLVVQGRTQLVEVAARGTAFGMDQPGFSGQALLALWQRMCLRSPHLERAALLLGLNLWPNEPVWPQMPVTLVKVPVPGAPQEAAVSPVLRLAEAASARRFALDAVQTGRVRGAPLRCVVVLGLLLASAGLGTRAWDHWRVSRELTQLRLAEQSQRQVGQSAQATEGRREDPARVRAVNAAIRQLNMPVSALLKALQVPRDLRVALLSVDLSADSGTQPQARATVKIVAEARTGAEMARYVSHIADRKPIVEAYLTRHEVQQSIPEQPYRFTVEAQWKP